MYSYSTPTEASKVSDSALRVLGSAFDEEVLDMHALDQGVCLEQAIANIEYNRIGPA